MRESRCFSRSLGRCVLVFYTCISSHPLDIYLVRVGKGDTSGGTATERFAESARKKGCDVTIVEYEDGKADFDMMQDEPRTREIIQDTLQFLLDSL